MRSCFAGSAGPLDLPEAYQARSECFSRLKILVLSEILAHAFDFSCGRLAYFRCFAELWELRAGSRSDWIGSWPAEQTACPRVLEPLRTSREGRRAPRTRARRPLGPRRLSRAGTSYQPTKAQRRSQKKGPRASTKRRRTPSGGRRSRSQHHGPEGLDEAVKDAVGRRGPVHRRGLPEPRPDGRPRLSIK